MPYARAVYEFRGAEARDLHFKVGDVIAVLYKDKSGWWKGENGRTGKKGDFPYNYVQEISKEEAAAMLETGGRYQAKRAAPETLRSIKVIKTQLGDSQLQVTMDVSVGSRQNLQIKKSAFQFRTLDQCIRKNYPTFDRSLPGGWSDKVVLGEVDSRKRERAFEAYMKRLMGNANTEFILYRWIFPRDGTRRHEDRKVEAIAELVAKDDTSGAPRSPTGKLVLAHVEYDWKRQDENEIHLRETQIIVVKSRDTGTPGWWEGRTVDNKTGLFPYNHVLVLDPRVSSAMLSGIPLKTAERAVTGQVDTNSHRRISLSGMFKKPTQMTQAATVKREKKVVISFSLPAIEAFDQLLEIGYVVMEDGRLFNGSKGGCKKGDSVEIQYNAYLWNPQNQTLVEFAASDLVCKTHPAGPLRFVAGKGQVIRGIEQAVLNIPKGKSVRVVITPDLAFGSVGNPPEVPPNYHVVYDMIIQSGGGSSSQIAPNVPVQNKTKGKGTNRTSKYAGRSRIDIATLAKRNPSPEKQFSLGELQYIVGMQDYEKHSINPDAIEDYLADDAFSQAFNMSRADFLLRPKWQQAAFRRKLNLG